MNIDNTNIPFADKVQLPTIRDQFAMAALATMNLHNFDKIIDSDNVTEGLAIIAYRFADAMLRARAE
jgi:hypothetical protein